MKDFAGKVAVVTGAASGMGLAFAQRFADEGMDVVLADIESEPLAMAEASIKAKGVRALPVRSNVFKEDDIKALADQAFATFGNVHVLCNNAGVASGGGGQHSWERPLADWEWVFGVNFMGVLHGIRHFLPRMLENGEEGHIVNTASLAGLLPSFDPYAVSKHGVVSITEGLYQELRAMNAKVSASVLCPGWINTNIIDSSRRNRPEEFGPAIEEEKMTPEQKQGMEMVRGLLRDGIPPEEVAGRVYDAIREQQLYIIPAQPYFFDILKGRYDNIVNQRNPVAVPIGGR
ncbi:MAG: SDR family NAD(P)-dependent oxidoreductase [Dehalococcoidia bacterium]